MYYTIYTCIYEIKSFLFYALSSQNIIYICDKFLLKQENSFNTPSHLKHIVNRKCMHHQATVQSVLIFIQLLQNICYRILVKMLLLWQEILIVHSTPSKTEPARLRVTSLLLIYSVIWSKSYASQIDTVM